MSKLSEKGKSSREVKASMKKAGFDRKILFVVGLIMLMVFAVACMLATGKESVENGKAYLTPKVLEQEALILLNGQWEFYWNRHLHPEDFKNGHPPQPDTLIKVPGSWDVIENGEQRYPNSGIATYRLRISYPDELKDPAIRLKNISSAYKLYVNGRLMTEVGTASEDRSIFREEEEPLILDLPQGDHPVELIFQVANLNYAKGGVRESPLMGSRLVLEKHIARFQGMQLIFIGSSFMFGIYYGLLFLLQRKNKSALLFSMLCLITATRSLIWGEAPIEIFWQEMPFSTGAYINYLTGYNLLPVFMLFVCSIFPADFNKKALTAVLLPSLFFDALLLTPPTFMSFFTDYLYILVLVQMFYIIFIAMRAVLRNRPNAMLMAIAISVFILTIIQDILHYKGLGGVNISYMFLYGNFAVIIAMCFVQAKQQETSYAKLVLYNEQLVESDLLKDKIMETEMSFLQAQIKPHFLYNALNAIANVCEKDGEKGGKLILDLAVYLRGSLEFNNLNKRVPLEKELEFVGTYFHIEQARFGDKIQWCKEIEVSLDCQVPVLVLQPLVENAVRHGISKRTEGGTVILRIKPDQDGIAIEIEDNGVGMIHEQWRTLLNDERSDRGVGLLNIHNRLIRMYGRGLTVASEAQCGTTVSFTIPDRRIKQ